MLPNDIGGVAVHAASRITALGRASEIIVSSVTRGLVEEAASASRNMDVTRSKAWSGRSRSSCSRPDVPITMPRRAPADRTAPCGTLWQQPRRAVSRLCCGSVSGRRRGLAPAVGLEPKPKQLTAAGLRPLPEHETAYRTALDSHRDSHRLMVEAPKGQMSWRAGRHIRARRSSFSASNSPGARMPAFSRFRQLAGVVRNVRPGGGDPRACRGMAAA